MGHLNKMENESAGHRDGREAIGGSMAWRENALRSERVAVRSATIVIAVPSGFSRMIVAGGHCAKLDSLLQTFFTIPQAEFRTLWLRKTLRFCGLNQYCRLRLPLR